MKKIYTVFVLLIILIAAPCYSESQAKKFYREVSKKLRYNRNDYPALTDAEFANFREIKTTGISSGKLFRSSSPINDWGKRNFIADKLSEQHGIKTFINLIDTQEKMRGYDNFSATYYSTQKAIALNLNLKFLSQDFQNKLARGIKFMARNEPPFLIHCNLGKDRTGIFCAVIEAVMGASIDEISNDYAVSFYNYFGVTPYSQDYNFVENEIRPFLASMFETKNIELVNLSAAAEKYLLKIGVAPEEIASLRNNLK